MRARRIATTIAMAAALAGCTEQPFEPDGAANLQPQFTTGPAPEAAFTATDFPLAILDPGTMNVTGGRYIIHGLTAQIRFEATDPRMTGFGTATVNGTLEIADGSGPVWGTFTINPDIGGSWTGTWHGHRSRTGPVWTGDIQWIMHGQTGPVAGLKAWGTETITTFAILPAAYIGQVEGTIRDDPAD